MPGGDGSAESESEPASGGAHIVREEARHVLDGQLRILRETDKKAMATARVVAVILGLLLSAASLSNAPTAALNPWVVVGSALLLGSLVVAVFTYSVDRPSYGIGAGYIDDVEAELDDPVAVERELLVRYAEWIEVNGDEIGSNSTYLLASQLLLIAGLTAVAYGMYRLV